VHLLRLGFLRDLLVDVHHLLQRMIDDYLTDENRRCDLLVAVFVFVALYFFGYSAGK
jgi:hypothetical protein